MYFNNKTKKLMLAKFNEGFNRKVFIILMIDCRRFFRNEVRLSINLQTKEVIS